MSTTSTTVLTIPKANVQSTLTNFPMRIDLSHMNAAFWSNVRSDGADIRVQDSTNTDIPFDVVKFDYTNQKGYLFAKVPSISASVDTVVNVLTTTNTTAPAVGATNGRNACWSGFSRVVMGEDTTLDRTGSGVTITHNGDAGWLTSDFGVNSISVSNPGGIAVSSSAIYYTESGGGSGKLVKYTLDLGTASVTKNTPFTDASATGNHVGQPWYDSTNDELWVPMETYTNSTTFSNQILAVFDGTTLAFKRKFSLTGTREARACAKNPATGEMWVADFTNGASIVKYNMSTGALIGTFALTTTINLIVGIAFVGSTMLLSTQSTTGGQRGIVEIDLSTGNLLGNRWNGHWNVAVTAMWGISPTVAGDGLHVFLQGDASDKIDNVSNLNRVRTLKPALSVAPGMWGIAGDYATGSGNQLPLNFTDIPCPTTTTWTIGFNYYVECGRGPIASPRALCTILDATVLGSSSASYLYDRLSPNPRNFNLWNSTNSSYIPGKSQSSSPLLEAPLPGQMWRLHYGQNGTSARKVASALAPDKAVPALGWPNIPQQITADATASARPTTTTTVSARLGWSSFTGEQVTGGFGFFYMASSYLSDAWISAEQISWLDPGSFYAVSGTTVPPVRSTSIATEVVRQMTPVMRVTSIALEVIRGATVTPTSTLRPQITLILGG